MVILVDYSRDDAFPADGSQAGHVPDTLHLHIRRPLPPGLVRPVAVVMPHILAEHPVGLDYSISPRRPARLEIIAG
jgi:hypothetical protein